ncbi:MAG TPA: hypothetical protein VGR68_12805 [Actinomycetota bacterium]|nr:hypothetical protein [Actinomycetota bacterium]
MAQALLTFIGVILGAAIAGSVSLWQARLVTKQERESRQALREQTHKDRRDAFQREAILALQDAMADLHRAVGRDQDEKLAKMFDASSAWPARKAEDPLPAEYLEAHRTISKLWPRVFDEELRDLTIQIRDASSKAIIAPDELEMWHRVNDLDKLASRFSSRVAALLPDLF